MVSTVRLVPGVRRQLSKSERAQVLEKTGARCHICRATSSLGGRPTTSWHTLAVVGSVENYLPAHRLCNHYRWDYSPEEFQWILKLGAWARSQIERDTPIEVSVRDKFYDHELRRNSRRRWA